MRVLSLDPTLGSASMPTRRIFELVVITSLAMHPVMGMVKLWAAKTLGTAPRGTVQHGIAEVATVIA